ncbi:aminotransferase [Marivirga tractuosa]|uniref:2-keto-4-methylthiobutyrate aminotransferase apoenzyme n=1 Tax=Marivirga tractuosa (strain ATCC 23168 / DSM 4126 / NBRC 15989 / NCIMB 1408 / VKM B-1430 / H-43) TaxID=643867 RepID=E4TPI3_MARTH|nr:methionine aminotransferase [Marivirga tractuosa]ADR21571.1 2-keto-4-methylthiobutyrate aminotransferase apoenzyme [Marivirga tractuosa DSM 4126]BDD13973.1 aminotransferase [Marivirga tractuosa]
MTEIQSKLPKVGTTIFTVMSQMAAESNAINLSQGFPDFPVSEKLIDLVYQNMQIGHNQYAPMPGLPQLREAIANKIKNTGGVNINIDTEITVSAGATEAIFSSVLATVNQGDEVIVLEPAYDCYIPAIELAGGKVVPVGLSLPNFTPDWQKVKDNITKKTRMIIINFPHNPSGAILTQDDITALKELLEENPQLIILSDEVYEHIIFDGNTHLSVLKDKFLARRSIAVSSFGKTFHATGWKIGYMVAPEAIMKEIRKVHQYNCFSVHTPSQYAMAEYLQNEKNYLGLSAMYEKKREFFQQAMQDSKFKIIPSYGTYFQVLDFSEISDMGDMEFAQYLIKDKGVASIPVSAFYSDKQDDKLLRFCFAKGEETLQKAADILCKI